MLGSMKHCCPLVGAVKSRVRGLSWSCYGSIKICRSTVRCKRRKLNSPPFCIFKIATSKCAKLLSMSWIAMQKLESGISLLINGKSRNMTHCMTRCAVPWSPSFGLAYVQQLNPHGSTPKAWCLCTHCFWTWEQTKHEGYPGRTNKKEMKQLQKPWYLAGTNLQTPIFRWFPRLELEEEVTICQETLQISPCKWQVHTRSSLGKKRDIFDLLDGCFQGNWGPKLAVTLAVLLRQNWKIQNKHE